MIGDVLKKLRESKRMTQLGLAKKLGIPRSTYSNYESGKREPDLVTIQLIADHFGVSVDYLTGHNKVNSHKIPEDKNELIIKEMVQKYNVDLNIPGNREKLEDLIKIAFHQYKSRS